MSKKLVKAIQSNALPLHEESTFDAILEAIGDAEIVLLGEASHGTSDFYEVRTDLTKRLIQEKGFTIIAVEGDWPSAQDVNQYIKGYDTQGKDTAELLKEAFHRWPTWMWANEEIEALVNWLKEENDKRQSEQRVGFYGIDLYSLYESIDEVLNFLKENPSFGVDLDLAKKAFSCFEPYNRMPEHYAISTSHFSDECIQEVSELLASIRSNASRYGEGQERDLNLAMNALVAKNAEWYYRAMMKEDAISWNVRDVHMVEAIKKLKDYHGDGAKIIVWEHNTHIGDASETSMKREDMINVGQLVREQYGKDNTYAIGFGTYAGTVIAAANWGDPFRRMTVPPAPFNTWEGQLHAAGEEDKVLLFNEENRPLFHEWIGHRAIGVVYHPEFKAYGNYVSSRVSHRYDAFIFIDQTTALRPL
ncbi:erythromycin esterase family protein [Sporosarcina sp. 179-K 3D1 HS]|uniref:erythromycin esterase family protein n=1 Tax=Sporosarcina sp. 179-K 3D1 HS TaxID=3232169 RepID=UPI0039A2D5CB